jgi:hypothetical protein
MAFTFRMLDPVSRTLSPFHCFWHFGRHGYRSLFGGATMGSIVQYEPLRTRVIECLRCGRKVSVLLSFCIDLELPSS